MKSSGSLRPRSSAALIVLSFLLASAPGILRAQAAQDTNSGNDLRFHKFQPPAGPVTAAAGTTQADFDALTQQQIVALELEKSSRTPAQRKIDSNVLYTLRMMAGKAPAPGIGPLSTGVDVDDSNNLLVDITANVNDQLLQQLSTAGALVWYSNARFHSIRAVVPSAQVETIAALPDVIFIAPKAESMTSSIGIGRQLMAGPMARPGFAMRAAAVRKKLAAALQAGAAGLNGTGQGSVTTQGDATHRTFDARGTFHVDGTGLKIGVLSDSANATGALTAAQASGDMPPTCPAGPPCFTLVQDIATGIDEGLAMMEIIHDMAPGASLFFATADVSEASFAQNILNLRTAGCDIIVDDVFYFDEPVFQDGIVAQAVNTVTAAGALYFSSAGNEGNVDSGTAGYFEGDFNDTGSPAFTFPGGAKTGTIHNFGTVATPVNGDIITARGNVYNLNWADPSGASANDYDLFVVSSAGVVKASSTNIQNGTQNPYEQVTPPALAAGDRLVVFKSTGAASVFFAINTIRGRLTVSTTGQTHGHSSASGTGIYSVAATPAAAAFGPGNPIGPFPNPFSAANNVELFTSDGPRRVFFNADGSAITPGDFSSTGGVVRSKPDITGADGVSTTLPAGSGLNPFFGTSAAAPAAASVAALVKSANPALTQTQIRTALTSTAIDIMAAGNDRDSGAGIVMAWEAVNSLGVTGTANVQLGTVTAVENPGNGNGVIEAGEGGKVTIQLRNTSGVVDATAITATLTSSTPGVTITAPGTSAYPNLPAGTGIANNTTPFTFTVASNAACALVIDFTLTVNFTGGTSPSVLTFSVPTGLITLSNNLGTLPSVLPGVTTATGAQTNRVTRNGVVSACGTAKAYPGTTVTAGTRTFDSYTFTSCKTSCLNPVLSAANGVNIFMVAYAGAFDPTTISTNYAADGGASGTVQTFGFNATQGSPYTLVVHDVPGTATGSPYSLQIPACAVNCNVNQVPIAVAQNVTVAAAVIGGSANANINNGSSDPDGDALTITQTPAGPYPHGATTVLLTVTDTKGATAQASAVVTVTDPALPPDLTITKTHTGNFSFGQTGATYTITVSNVGTGLTVGTVTVVDTLPAIPNTLVATAISGTNWTCVLATLTCTRSDVLAATASYEPITLTVNVPNNIQANFTNSVTVSGGGDVSAGNNTASDATHVGAPLQLVATGGTITVNAGSSGTMNFTVNSSPGVGSVSFACSGLPSGAACSFNPPSENQLSTTVVLTVTTTLNSATIAPPSGFGPTAPILAVLIGLAGLGLRRKKAGMARLRLAVALAVLLAVAGCGVGPKPLPPPTAVTTRGTFNITVTATGTGATASVPLTLNIQ